MMDIVEKLKRIAKGVFIIVEEPVASDISKDILLAIVEIERLRALLEAAPPADVEPVGELRCDATTGHVYGVYWYERSCPAIGTKVYTQPPADKDAERMKEAVLKIIDDCESMPRKYRFKVMRHAIDKAMGEV